MTRTVLGVGERALPEYAVYALKFATRDARRGDHFHPDSPGAPGDPHDDTPMPMDYFVWAVVGDDATWVVDTGFLADEAAARRRTLLRTPAEALASIGIDAATVGDVIITHLHYDHIGGAVQFPSARFHVQDREIAFATGRHMLTDQRHGFTGRHIADVVLAVHAGRVVFHDGDAELAPGLSVHHVGGHTDGLQVVRVHTRRGWIVIASDAAHYYEMLERQRAFHLTFDFPALVAGYERVVALADAPDAYVPGHDPAVLDRYPAVAGLEGRVARLDLPPEPDHTRPDTHHPDRQRSTA